MNSHKINGCVGDYWNRCRVAPFDVDDLIEKTERWEEAKGTHFAMSRA